MPITVMPPGQSGGGFFDAASRSFEEFSKRAQEAQMKEKELTLQKEQLKIQERAAQMQAKLDQQRINQTQTEFQQRMASNQATMEAMSPGLMQEFPNVNWQAALGADPDQFQQMVGRMIEMRDVNNRNTLGQRQLALGQGELDARNRAIDVELEIARMRDAREAASDVTERSRIDLGLAQLSQEAEQFQRQLYLDQIRTMSEIAIQNQMPSSEVPKLLERFYGGPVGDPEAIRAQDRAAFETEALDGETFTEFVQRKTADRAMGFFSISAEDRPLIESFINTGSPNVAMQRARQAVAKGQLPEEALQSINAILSIVFGSAQFPRTFEGPGTGVGSSAQPPSPMNINRTINQGFSGF